MVEVVSRDALAQPRSPTIAVENAFSGASLGTKWSDPNKRLRVLRDLLVLSPESPPARQRKQPPADGLPIAKMVGP